MVATSQRREEQRRYSPVWNLPYNLKTWLRSDIFKYMSWLSGSFFWGDYQVFFIYFWLKAGVETCLQAAMSFASEVARYYYRHITRMLYDLV
jgi:hypothetical protein